MNNSNEELIVYKNKKKHVKLCVIFGTFILLAEMAYVTFVFCPISSVRELRDTYIETAMSTFTHHWLAEAFIPSSIVKSVMNKADAELELALVEQSSIPTNVQEELITMLDADSENIEIIKSPKEEFCEKYYEIDASTLPDDLDYGNIELSDISDMGIKTMSGDAVWAIDEPNEILIIEVKGNGYVGKLAIVKDSSRVTLADNTKKGRGSTINELCEQYDAVLGINASGFSDVSGNGYGTNSIGYSKCSGDVKNPSKRSYSFVGFDYDDYLHVGTKLDVDELRDVCQFYPILICDGEVKVKGNSGMGINPRSAIGQTADKSTLFLIIEGRRLNCMGTTVGECAQILARYGCYNAINLDGGSSASMTYKGKMITKSSSPMAEGRYVPNAWVVKSKK